MTSIMIVEDEEFLQDLYKEVLVDNGYEVVAIAYNGVEAVKVYSELGTKTDLVLMDHRMPLKNGVEAMREILEIHPAAKIIFLTADYSIAKASMLGGAVGYISKPFEMEALLKAIERAMGGLGD
jgi:two-component system chemotaxis response regulator CheY